MTSRFDSINFFPALDSIQLNIWDSPAKNMRFNVPFDRVITVTEAYVANLPGIAHDLLGDVALWWVLLEYNGLSDPILDVKVGTALRIPQRTSLIAYLESSQPDGDRTIII